MGLEDLGHLLLRLPQAEIVAHLLGLVTLERDQLGDLADLAVKPLLAAFKWREYRVPTPLALRLGLDVLDDDVCDREHPPQPMDQPQFPLPACLGRGRDTAPGAVGSRLPTRRLAIAAGLASVPPVGHGLL